MFSNIGIPGLILIFVIALIIFSLQSFRKSAVPPAARCLNLKAPQKHWSQMKSRTSRPLRKTKRQAESDESASASFSIRRMYDWIKKKPT